MHSPSVVLHPHQIAFLLFSAGWLLISWFLSFFFFQLDSMQHRRRALWVLIISIAQGLEHKRFLIQLFQRNSKRWGSRGKKNKRWFLCLCWGNCPLLWKRLVIQSAQNPNRVRESRMISTLFLPPPELLFIPIWRQICGAFSPDQHIL